MKTYLICDNTFLGTLDFKKSSQPGNLLSCEIPSLLEFPILTITIWISTQPSFIAKFRFKFLKPVSFCFILKIKHLSVFVLSPLLPLFMGYVGFPVLHVIKPKICLGLYLLIVMWF